MERLLSILLLLCLGLPLECKARSVNLDSLYAALDEAIAQYPVYVARHEKRLSDLRAEYLRAGGDSARYSLLFKMYEGYKAFVNDSAIYYLNRCIRLADSLADRSAAVKCRSLLALRCSNTGMYDEAQRILSGIQPEGISKEALGIYYNANQHVYNELAYYTRMDDMYRIYREKFRHYRGLMRQTLPPDDDAVFLSREMEHRDEGDYRRSMQVNDEWLSHVERGSHRFALVALFRYLEYMAQNDSTEMMYWLVESALSDVRNAVMDQGSMWEIANQLMLKGDVDRAYRYISFTSDCTDRYGSRQRSWQITPLLSSIAKQYKAESEHTKRNLWKMITAISVLALVLVLLVVYVNRQRKRLADARDQLSKKNKELSRVNEQLSDSNADLSSLNAQLSAVNRQLATLNDRLNESNRVKEEYIGRFMSLCSQYIDKLDSYRKMVNKKMKNKELDELFRISKSTELKEKELEELYGNFDSVFLHLFPNFIDGFNSLLTPEMQIHPKEENRLTTDIRIFALIRLGIEDSSKIAEFLHYSVNTIYNYRARIKNGAIGNRETFERRVKELGLPK